MNPRVVTYSKSTNPMQASLITCNKISANQLQEGLVALGAECKIPEKTMGLIEEQISKNVTFIDCHKKQNNGPTDLKSNQHTYLTNGQVSTSPLDVVCEDVLCKEHNNNNNMHRKRTKITFDNVSKFFFPLCHAIFNLFFWIYFSEDEEKLSSAYL